MQYCKKCGSIYEDIADKCYECDTQLEAFVFNWPYAANATYRKQYGSLPELNFCGQEGFDLIQAPPVEHSKYAKMNAATPHGFLGRTLLDVGKGIGKGFFGAIKGTLEIATGNVTGGVQHLVDGTINVYKNPIEHIQSDKDVTDLIIRFENNIWSKLYFLKNFVPVTTEIGNQYYVGLADVYTGFKVFEDGTYFEGLFVFGKPSIGIEINPLGVRYIGSFENGGKSHGLNLYSDGSYYYGDFQNGYSNGQGSYICDEYFYCGEWSGGCREGTGIEKKSNGKITIGQWKLDMPVK